MPGPGTWQELQISFIKHVTCAKSLPESQLFLGQNSAFLLTEFLQVSPRAEGAHGAERVAWHMASFSLREHTGYIPARKI